MDSPFEVADKNVSEGDINVPLPGSSAVETEVTAGPP